MQNSLQCLKSEDSKKEDVKCLCSGKTPEIIIEKRAGSGQTLLHSTCSTQLINVFLHDPQLSVSEFSRGADLPVKTKEQCNWKQKQGYWLTLTLIRDTDHSIVSAGGICEALYFEDPCEAIDHRSSYWSMNTVGGHCSGLWEAAR